jgi:hypothetical protein
MNARDECSARNAVTYQLEFTLDHDDLLALARHCLPRSRVRSVLMFAADAAVIVACGMLLVTFLVLLGRFFTGEWYHPIYLPFLLMSVLSVVFVFATSPAIKRRADDRVAERWATHFERQQSLGTRKLTASREEIAVASANGETTRKWKAVKSVETTDSHAFIRGDVLVVVPRRAFSEEREFEEFVDSVKQWICEGHQRGQEGGAAS